MDFEMDMETLVAGGLAVVGGIVALFMMKFSGASFIFKIAAALGTMVLSFFVCKFIFNK